MDSSPDFTPVCSPDSSGSIGDSLDSVPGGAGSESHRPAATPPLRPALMAEGLSNAAIADRLGLSEKTVYS